MSQNHKTIKLSNCEVDILSDLTWGKKNEIESSLMDGVKINSGGLSGIDSKGMLEAKYKLLEVCIVEIRQGDEKIKYNRAWAENLTADDGDLLYDEVNTLTSKKN
jgi:hypothetical protein